MLSQEVHISREQAHKLLSAGSGDAAILYLYLHTGNDLANAARDLNMKDAAIQPALATLRQMGLWKEKEKVFLVGERPHYTEDDVIQASRELGFKGLKEEVQRALGRFLTTEDLKILLGFTNYLGLPYEVITLLVYYCKERNTQRGKVRNPSLRTIEKEAYHWAELGIDTMEEAGAYISRQNVRYSRLGQLMEQLQIRGRSLTAAEERYAHQWLDWGFDAGAIAMAYERTCLNTGGLSWAYMNKILNRWQQHGLLTAEAVKQGDVKPGSFKAGQRQLDSDELAAIEKMFQEV